MQCPTEKVDRNPCTLSPPLVYGVITESKFASPTYSRFILLDYSFILFIWMVYGITDWKKMVDGGTPGETSLYHPCVTKKQNSNVNPSLFVSCFERIEGENRFNLTLTTIGKHFLRSYNLTLETFWITNKLNLLHYAFCKYFITSLLSDILIFLGIYHPPVQ